MSKKNTNHSNNNNNYNDYYSTNSNKANKNDVNSTSSLTNMSNKNKSDLLVYKKEKTNDNFDLFTNIYSRLYNKGYYWGPITYELSERLLRNKENGSFLIRDSRHDNYLFTITFKSNDHIFHVRIEHISNGKFNFQENFSTKFESQDLITFIENTIEKSTSGHYFFIKPRANAPGMQVKFLYPISRFNQRPISSLQHLARFNILKYVRKDNIDKLNIPNKLKLYLKEGQIYTEIK